MLKRVEETASGVYMDFSSINTRDAAGVGRCFVYNAVMKHTRSGSPFITLFMRDVKGNTIPGYIFDLASPMVAGLDLKKVIGSIVEITWEENFINSRGMTVRVTKVLVITNPTADELTLFTGAVENIDEMLKDISNFAEEMFRIRLSLPVQLRTLSVNGYSSGKVGGLAKHYWKMLRIIRSMDYLGKEEFRRLAATYILYIFVHHNVVRAEQENTNDINFSIQMINKIAPLIETLGVGDGARELMSIIQGQTPKDIYAKTVVSISDMVKQVDNEFTTYRTLPVAMEGNAGYGVFRRYDIESDT